MSHSPLVSSLRPRRNESVDVNRRRWHNTMAMAMNGDREWRPGDRAPASASRSSQTGPADGKSS